jgi:transposase-like protein
MRKYRRYAEAFKLKIVADYVGDKVSLRELSRRHGIGRNLIVLWAGKYEPAKLAEKRSRRKRLLDYERKIAELEGTITLLTIEIDMLRTRRGQSDPRAIA